VIRSIKLLFIYAFFTNAYAAQHFEGEIIFSASHKYRDTSIHSTPNLSEEVKYSISAEFVRIDQSTQLGNQAVIYDTLSNTKTIVIQQNEHTIAIKINKESDPNLSIKTSYFDDSLTICGISCKKAVWNTYRKDDAKLSYAEIYYTNSISGTYAENFDDLLGFPLKYEIISGDIESIYTATSISKTTIDPTIFKVDKKVKTYSMEEFKSLMGQ
tara:strand:- start:234 stop:872 length:639 start_codon:yes stop_codon:yes gene_type:complete